MSPDKGAHEEILDARDAGMPLKIPAKMRQPTERKYYEDQVRPLLGGDIEHLGAATEIVDHGLTGFLCDHLVLFQDILDERAAETVEGRRAEAAMAAVDTRR